MPFHAWYSEAFAYQTWCWHVQLAQDHSSVALRDERTGCTARGPIMASVLANDGITRGKSN
jgi:hypothetical protein